MATPNPQLLRSLAELWRTRQSATIVLDSGRSQRSLHVDAGHFIGAESDLLTERIGVMLVADGKLDAAQVSPLVDAARANGLAVGEQLVADGLVDPETLSSTLQRQFTTRLDRTLRASGHVQLARLSAARATVHKTVPAAVLGAFRRLPLEVASQIVASLPPSNARLQEDLLAADHLDLEASEPRCFRQLAAGMDATAVLDRAQDQDAAVRLCAALVALGAIPTEVPDPVAQYLRTA